MNQKSIAAIIIFTIFCSSIFAQINKTISTSEIEVFPDSTEWVNGHYYRHIQFVTLPSNQQQIALSNEGIKLLYYISSNTYLASVSSKLTPAQMITFQIALINKVKASDKMLSELNEAITNNKFPAFSTNSDGKIGITFTYPNDIPNPLIINLLNPFEITYLNPNSFRGTVWLSKNEIVKFVNQPFVIAAELVDNQAVPENNRERTNHRNNWLAQEFPGGRKYNGEGVNVMLQDDGIIGPHIDYTGRIIKQYLNYYGGNHGSHVAGIIMGAGNLNALSRGMGWGSNLYVYQANYMSSGNLGNSWQGFDSIYSHYKSKDVVITSTSYGDGGDGGYSTLTQALDQQNRDMDALIHVFSAGNSGTADFGYGAGAGWGNITGGHKQSKNSIAVGNVDYTDVINTTSSRGPAHDGRLKPELVAVGTNVSSTTELNTYAVKTGTSMACPAVSGTLTELYQAYKKLNGGLNPPSALMKAIIMNTADDLGNPGPDFIYGYGRINGRKSIIPIEQNLYLMDSISNTATNKHKITVPKNTGRVKIMVYWHDYPAAINAGVALVNDIKMQVTNPIDTLFNPWILDYYPDATNLNSDAIRGIDIRNNHEQITIDNPIDGNYTVSINGSNIPYGPQKYYLSWYFEPLNDLVLTYPNGGESFVPNYIYNIRWDALGNSGIFKLEYSNDNGANWKLINNSIAATQRYYDWAAPFTLSGKYLVRVTRGTTQDVSDVNFSVFSLPANVVVDWACPDSLQISWTAITGATSYDVFILGSKYMDSVVNVKTNKAVIYNLDNFNKSYWFSVRGRGAQNAVGLRADAIFKSAGVQCPSVFDVAIKSITSPQNVIFACTTNTNVDVEILLENPGKLPVTDIPLSYSINEGAAITAKYVGTIAARNSINYKFSTAANLSSTGINKVKVWASYPGDAFSSNDTQTLKITRNTASIKPPFTEDFETFPLCLTLADCESTICNLPNGFENLNNGQSDDIDWRTSEGLTATLNSGPAYDYLPGTSIGNYLYLEASTCYEKTALLLSPCIDLTDVKKAVLNMAYHMYGSGIGSLHIDIYSKGIWIDDVFTKSGDQGNQWNMAQASLTPYIGQIINIRVRGITGATYYSDIAIDALSITSVSRVLETPSNLEISIFPNPTSSQINITAPAHLIGTNYSIFDCVGKRIKEGKITSSKTLLDLEDLSEGLYLISFGNRSEQVLRFIKK